MNGFAQHSGIGALWTFQWGSQRGGEGGGGGGGVTVKGCGWKGWGALGGAIFDRDQILTHLSQQGLTLVSNNFHLPIFQGFPFFQYRLWFWEKTCIILTCPTGSFTCHEYEIWKFILKFNGSVFLKVFLDIIEHSLLGKRCYTIPHCYGFAGVHFICTNHCHDFCSFSLFVGFMTALSALHSCSKCRKRSWMNKQCKTNSSHATHGYVTGVCVTIREVQILSLKR